MATSLAKRIGETLAEKDWRDTWRGRGGGKEEEEEEEEEEKEQAALIKSNNPHLAGGGTNRKVNLFCFRFVKWQVSGGKRKEMRFGAKPRLCARKSSTWVLGAQKQI